ncbi:MAG: ArsI/CadI family heavy metal resistance metalloenzyme [Bacteroidota bacterium]
MKKSVYPRMHVSLYVSNLDKTVEFYEAFFGVEASKVAHRYAKFILDSPSLIISFIENPDRVSANFGHLGFQMETKSQMEKQLAKARAKNIVAKEEMGTACCYAVQDKFWVNDPDGFQWEVYYFHEDVSFNDPHYELSDTEVCCVTPVKSEKPRVRLSDLAAKDSCEPGSGCC